MSLTSTGNGVTSSVVQRRGERVRNLRSPRSVHADALVRAVLAAEWPLPLATGLIGERVGLPGDPVVLRMLNRLASRGEAEKFTFADKRSCYWRLATDEEVTA
ncbi:MAG: hypothetical protein J2P17_06340 [Mycobacterium sp.]|nr:hypothetical protein [Mycobacterium sp.]